MNEALQAGYVGEVFGRQDEQLAGLMERAVRAGLPDIAVSPEAGRLLTVLAGLGAGGTAVELGTLGGYSAIWIARGLPRESRLITVEYEQKHADFAHREFERAGVADRIEIRVGAALEVLPELHRELGDGSVGFAFFDAIKAEYPSYLELLRPMLADGAVLVADNALSSDWAIYDPPGSSPGRDGADRFNRTIANDPMFDTGLVPSASGMAVAHKRPEHVR